MTNPFKELDELEDSIKAPASIKNKVMGSYGFIVNIAKVVEFIVGSLTNVCTGMLNLLDEKPPSAAPTNQNQIMGFSSYSTENEEESPSWDENDDFGFEGEDEDDENDHKDEDTGNQDTDDKDFD
ncbi:MAG: hypothetical protein AB8B69_26310 [Chitinophagales bacterium]